MSWDFEPGELRRAVFEVPSSAGSDEPIDALDGELVALFRRTGWPGRPPEADGAGSSAQVESAPSVGGTVPEVVEAPSAADAQSQGDEPPDPPAEQTAAVASMASASPPSITSSDGRGQASASGEFMVVSDDGPEPSQSSPGEVVVDMGRSAPVYAGDDDDDDDEHEGDEGGRDGPTVVTSPLDIELSAASPGDGPRDDLEVEVSPTDGVADIDDIDEDRAAPPALLLPRLVGGAAASSDSESDEDDAARSGGEATSSGAGFVLPSLTSPATGAPDADAIPEASNEAAFEGVDADSPGETAEAKTTGEAELDEFHDDGVPGEVERVSSGELVELEQDAELGQDADVEEVDDLEEVEEVEVEAVEEVASQGPPSAPPASSTPAGTAPPPPTPPSRKKPWYEDVFAEHYTSIEPLTAPDAAARDVTFIRERIELAEGAKVLDVGCGAGHHAFAFRDEGMEVTGVDSSLAMLLHASQTNERREAQVSFLHADMRKLPEDEGFDLVTCLGTTFGYFDDDQNLQILQGMAKRLGPDGKLVLQMVNRDHLVSKVPCRSWWGSGPALVLDEADMNPFRSTLKVHRTIVFEDGRQFEHHLAVRVYALHELGKMFAAAGLKVLEVSGSRDTPGRFFGATSPDIWVFACAVS